MEERGEIEQEGIELGMRDEGRRGEYCEWRVNLKTLEKVVRSLLLQKFLKHNRKWILKDLSYNRQKISLHEKTDCQVKHLVTG